jgi:ornithine carbamoyltransferase
MISTNALHGKHLLSLADFTPDEITFLIELAD